MFKQPKTACAVMILIIIAQIYFILGMVKALNKTKENVQHYVTANHCARTGFAGKYAIAVYQCDTGMLLESEIRDSVKMLFVSPL